jgi:two-component system, chemotaxis family, response regulator Rcp1
MGGSGSNPNPDEDQPSASLSPSEKTTAGVRANAVVIEDNDSDVFLIQDAIQKAGVPVGLQIISDGEKALRFFDRVDADDNLACPALVILDINLPKRPGGDVLKHIRKSRRCANAVVITISTSDSLRDREHMTSLGANSYFHKPSEYDEFMKLGELVKKLLASASTEK